MHLHKDIEAFIKECYPKGLPLYRRDELKKELLSHIFDKMDFLTESGMSEEESVSEAVKSMGEPAKIRQSFGKLYRFERLPGMIAFVVLSALCICAIFSGFILISADTTDDYPTIFHYLISASFTGSIVFMYIYGYRRRNASLLLSLTVYMLLNLLTFLYTSGIFQSVSIGITIILCALFNIPEQVPDSSSLFRDAEMLVLIGALYLTITIMVVLFIVGVILTVTVLTESKRKKKSKKIKQKKPLIVYFYLIFSLVILSSVLFHFTAQEYSFMQNNIMNRSISNIIDIKKGRSAYEELTSGMSSAEVNIVLRKYGFKEYKRSDGVYSLPDFEPGYSMSDSNVYIIENTSYSLNSLYNDTVLILNFKDKKLNFKQLYLYRCSTIAFSIGRNEKTWECYENYLTIKEGDSREDVLKKFPESVAFLETAYFDFEADIEIINFRATYSDRQDMSFHANVNPSLCFVGSKLAGSEFEAFGKDRQYNYREMELNNKK